MRRFLQGCTTARCVYNEHVGVEFRKDLRVLRIEFVGVVEETAVTMERPAASLGLGNQDITTGAIQHANRRSVHWREPFTGNAAQEERNAHS